TIVVSGYSDFEYTKEAIRHNAFDYLLKPVKKDELAGVLEKALAQLEQLDRQEQMQRRATDGQLETWLSQALFHEDATAAQEQAREEETDEGIPACWREGEFAVWVGKPDRYADDNTDPQRLLACMEEKLAQSRAFFFGGQWAFALTRSAGGSGELVATIAAGRLSQPELSVLLADVQSRLKQ
ncbi:hypothetical protein K0U00_46535, partial [Paenibacillus sepulcri]|nr:hypothetical protein [Paenibacillus sepulcri]